MHLSVTKPVRHLVMLPSIRTEWKGISDLSTQILAHPNIIVKGMFLVIRAIYFSTKDLSKS